jgi:RNA polymerase sigma-70 factor (ECF subfamily)
MTEFEKIYKENYEKISRYCYYRVRNQSDTEDIVAETFAKAYFNMDKFNSGSHLAWLYTIAKNTILDNQKGFYQKHFKVDQEMMEDLHEDKNIEDELITRDEYADLSTKLDRLKPDYREAIVLKFIQELEYSEIAEIMKKSINAIRLLISKGLKELRLMNNNDQKKIALLFFPNFISFSKEKVWDKTNENISNINTLPMNTNISKLQKIFKITSTKLILGAAAGLIILAGTTALLFSQKSNTENKPIVSAATIDTTKTINTTSPVITTEAPVKTSVVIPTNTSAPITTPVPTATTLPTPTNKVPVTTLPADPYTGWTNYYETNLDINMKLPSGWTFSSISTRDPLAPDGNQPCDASVLTFYKSSNLCTDGAESFKVIITDNKGSTFQLLGPTTGTGGECSNNPDYIYTNFSFTIQGKNYPEHIYKNITNGSFFDCYQINNLTQSGTKSKWKIAQVKITAADANKLSDIKKILESISYK